MKKERSLINKIFNLTASLALFIIAAITVKNMTNVSYASHTINYNKSNFNILGNYIKDNDYKEIYNSAVKLIANDSSIGYSLQYDLASPTGEDKQLNKITMNEYINKNGIGKSATSKVMNIVTNGYPANEEYWNKFGVTESDAQQLATQIAIWIVVNGTEGNEDYQSQMTSLWEYINKLVSDENNKANKLEEMIVSLVNNAESKTTIATPNIKVNAKSITNNANTLTATFTVTSTNAYYGYKFKIDGTNEDIIVKEGENTLELINDYYIVNDTNDTNTITVTFAKSAALDKNITIRVYPLGLSESTNIFFTDNQGYKENNTLIQQTINIVTTPSISGDQVTASLPIN